MHEDTHKGITLHVCNEEIWRFANIKRDIEAGRYANLNPVNLKEWRKAKKKFRKGAKYGRGQYPE